MKCLCGRKIFRKNKWNLCVSCYRTKTIEYWKNPNICLKCDTVLYMRNDSGLCNKHRHGEYMKEYIYLPHRYEKELNKRNKYKKDHRKEISLKQKLREKSDLNFKIKRRLRHRLYLAVKNKQKAGSAITDLGCSIDEFRTYTESLFKLGMTWDNYGNEWEFDHIQPLMNFDLTDYKQLKTACNYINLQPIFKKDHFIKSSEDIKRKSNGRTSKTKNTEYT